MSQRGKRKRSRAEWQWLVLGVLVRLAERYGEWPSAPEIAKEIKADPRWTKYVVADLKAEELVVLVGDGAGAGWMPTAEGLRWRGLEMPTLDRTGVPPRRYRWAGIGACRAWHAQERLKARRAAQQVFDGDLPSDKAVVE